MKQILESGPDVVCVSPEAAAAVDVAGQVRVAVHGAAWKPGLVIVAEIIVNGNVVYD